MINPPSYAKVDYMLRKKKQIERKIILDILSRISVISSYKYIGMGSIYYYDFIMFHKYLNITSMTSIDNKLHTKRFNFNKPYSFIDFENTLSTEFLNRYDFGNKVIIWLDYDSQLFDVKLGTMNGCILDDLEIIANRAPDESILIITIDVTIPTTKSKILDFQQIFREYLSQKYLDETLFGKIKILERQYKYMIQNIVLNYLEDTCKYSQSKFKKIFSFFYKDTSPMYTIGLLKADNKGFLDIFHSLKGIEFANRRGDRITSINVPNLTYREKLYLDQNVHIIKERLKTKKRLSNTPKDILDSLDFEIGSTELLVNYIKFYKYYPQYHEDYI